MIVSHFALGASVCLLLLFSLPTKAMLETTTCLPLFQIRSISAFRTASCDSKCRLVEETEKSCDLACWRSAHKCWRPCLLRKDGSCFRACGSNYHQCKVRCGGVTGERRACCKKECYARTLEPRWYCRMGCSRFVGSCRQQCKQNVTGCYQKCNDKFKNMSGRLFCKADCTASFYRCFDPCQVKARKKADECSSDCEEILPSCIRYCRQYPY